jgi:divalent metal cation (Fe/Co/Zn/Cd) transporter
MLYHPFILTIGLVLFVAGAVVGFRKARALPHGEKSPHPLLIYPAYIMFLFAMGLYYGYERNIALEVAGGREAFAATGLLTLHAASIAVATIFLTLTLLYGLALRNRIFTDKIGRKEVVHMVMGAIGVISYTLAVASGLAMYARVGVL